jgi:glycosyltransferase involved in cell wall biosynthesis
MVCHATNKILIVAPSVVATFVHQDHELLRSAFDTELISVTGTSAHLDLRRRIRMADAVLIWFAGRHAAPAVWWARRNSKPIITVVGGYEAAWDPEIGYGTPPGSLRERYVRWILRNSNRILAVSNATLTGIHRLAPEVAPKTRLLYNAVDTDRFAMIAGTMRRGVSCVGAINKSTLVNKGWLLYRDVASAMPDVPFTAIGPATDEDGRKLVSQRPPNLRYLGRLTGVDLVAQYQEAAVYWQGSRHESFSLSLAEAMACGCIPVVSRRGALPEVAGDSGFYLDDFSVENAASTIRKALAAPDSERAAARQRIVDHFGIEHRRAELCAEVAAVLQTGSRCSG